MQIAVLGAGYVGLVSAACLAELGHSVSIHDVDPERIEPLRRGEIPFHEPGLAELVARGVRGGKLCPTREPAEALAGADLALVSVGTPLHADGSADLTQVESVCRTLAKAPAGLPIVLRSTLPVGSTPMVVAWLGRTTDEAVVINPEFLRQGSAIADFRSPTRIVIGTSSGERTSASESLLEAYRGIEAPLVITDYNSAEMIKNGSNAFLAAKLSFINEIADLCEAFGANIDDVVTGIGLDPRIGSMYMRPGIGFGGSCLPKELANLVRLGEEGGVALPLMAGAAQTNEGRADRIAGRIEGLIGSVAGLRVAVLGLSFKPDTDDVRRSPSLALVHALIRRGANVVAHDPVVSRDSPQQVVGLVRAASPEEAIESAALVVLATEWPAYLALDWGLMAQRAANRVVVDGRNALDARGLRDAGWSVIRIGQHADALPRAADQVNRPPES